MNTIVYKGISKNGNEFLVRYPSEFDAEEMNKYFNALSAEKTFIRFQGEQYSLDQEKEYLIDSLKRISEKKAIQLLVFSKEKIIGVSSVDLSDGAQLHVGTFGISILKGFRNEGIGKILVEQTIKEAVTNLTDLKLIILSVFGNNSVGLKFYEKFGFKKYGLLPDGIYYNNKYENNILMYKKIS